MNDDFEVRLPAVLADEPPVDVAIILGSGFSALAGLVEDPRIVTFDQVPGFPLPERMVLGHAGRLMIGSLAGRRVACFQGRIHRYQGFTAREVSFPVRLAHAMGARTLIVTNAAGGVAPHIRPGDVVLLSDQINLTGDSPLVGWAGPEGGTPFVPMRDAFDPVLRELALAAAAETGVALVPEGVYLGLLGPAFETPAEVGMVRALGGDVVGMSTVNEVIAARALGMRVLGLSLVTNVAAGVGLSHTEVLDIGRRAEEEMSRLAMAILQRLT